MKRRMTLKTSEEEISEPSSFHGLIARATRKRRSVAANVLLMTEHFENLHRCQHMILYLTSKTWTQGEAWSDDLAGELEQAMGFGVHILLAHEMPSTDGETARNSCDFSAMFSHPQGATPQSLLMRGICK